MWQNNGVLLFIGATIGADEYIWVLGFLSEACWRVMCYGKLDIMKTGPWNESPRALGL
jgi:hypothetical protein